MGCSLFYFGDGCYFLNDQKGTKESPGAAFDEHLAAPVLIGGLPPDPQLRGTPSWKIARKFRRAKSGQAGPSCLGGTGPYNVEIWKHLRCTNTAYPGITVAAGPLTTTAPNR